MPSSTAAVLLLLSFALRPLSSTLQPRRILHQPFLPLVSSPPSPPPAPSLPFTSSTPENSPFFRSYPSPPSPPSPASLATFPANISSLSVPRPAKPNTASNKLIITAVAAVVAAVAVVSLAVFLHLRKRGGSSAFSESKTQRSDNCSTVSFNQAPSTHHIPKLQRPSQTSAEFLYLGTLVNSHAPGGAAAFHGSSNASNTRKFDSPELRPLPPLIIQQSLRPNNAEVVSSKDDESEEFYSPKGSINGKESSIGTGSASTRAFAAIEVENFNGSTSNSSSTYSSSVSGSGSASPVRSVSSNLSPVNNTSPINSMPKSPDLIEIQTIAQLPEQTLSPPPETQGSLLRESASPSPPCSCSPERYSRRSEESSPNASDQDVESTVRSNSSIQHNTTVFPIPPEIRGLTVSESAPPLPLRSPSPDRFLTRDESSHMNSNVADQNVESPVRISSPTQHNSTLLPVPILPEMEASVLPESASSIERCLRRDEVSSPRNSDVWDQNVESPVRISSPTQHMSTVLPVPGPPETEALVLLESESSIERRLRRVLLESASSIERCLRRDEESSRRNSHVPHQNVESPAPISSPTQHNSTVLPVPTLPEMEALVLPESASSIERCLRRDEESSPRNSDVWDQNVESPVTISSPTQHNSTVRPPTETEASVLPESASSTERCLRRDEQSSPRNSDVSDQNVESPVTISSPVKLNSTDIPVPEALEMPAFIFPESASSPTPIPSSPERCSMRSEESSPRSSNVSDQNVESLVSAAQHNSTIISPPPEILLPPFSSSPERYLKSEESSPRDPNDLDQNMESPVRISSPAQLNSTEIPTSPELNGLVIPESTSSSGSSSPERYSGAKEELLPRASDASDQDIEPPVSSSVQEPAIVIATHSEKEGLVLSSPRISNASDQNDASPARISNVSDQHVASPVRTSNASDQYSTGSEGSPSMILNDSDQNVESPTRNNSLEQHNAATIPPPAPPVSVTPPPLLSVPPPPPPPPPMSKAWHSPRTPTPPRKQGTEPPVLKNPLKPIAFESSPLISPMQLPSNEDKESPSEYSSKNEESPPKPKLKPLHWDKVRASSDREMVWDQLKCSSFELNEEMIETLFVVNTPKPNPKETTRWQVLPSAGQDNGDRVLDPKKAQNIAILLKALHVTVDEVCEGLLEGNADILGTELLESLLKMAPTKEEERKLKEYKDDSPIKLGPAERFLKAVVDVPHAFRRVEVMLYISNFESEVEYLKKSFATLEAACEELRTSRMFLKLLEAVLKTGNRMNVGTNRGDAHAFKLDTLLKLVDVKGADGKTTLLHFVVQEIIRSEGARLSGEGPQDKSDDAKCRKLGLQVVSALSSELSNVKKAAVMDAEMLSTDVSKLSKGIADVREVIKLNEDNSYSKFSDNIQNFVERAEEEICRTQAQESLALSLVKEITEYFHGNSVLEEAHPFRIFLVVRDFLTVLDRVCKEVGLINERTMVSSAHKFPVPVNPMLQQVSAVFHKQQHTSSDDESLPLNV